MSMLTLLVAGARDALNWWTTLSSDEKARWLQCDATAAEIDADLMTAEGAVVAVGDAYDAALASSDAPK